MLKRMNFRVGGAAALIGVWVIGVGAAMGQAKPTSERGSELAFYGDVTYLHSGYSASANDIGYSAGLDFTPFLTWKFQPALELRATEAGPNTQTEYSYSGGVKVATRIGRLHPYVTALKGLGFVYFRDPIIASNGPYTHDSSRMWSAGVGADFDLSRQWQVRADYSQQFWALYNYTLWPSAVSFGINYRIPFR
jgi:opacity protein-like surface antigen